MSEAATYILLWLSALGAGIMNAVAGGGTMLTFSALLAVVPPVIGNATSTVALVPGSLASAWGYRREVRQVGHWIALLLWPSVIGGAIGSLLVTRLDPKYFEALVPWLILSAALLFLCQPVLVRLAGIGKPHATPSKFTLGGVIVFQLFVGVYGGYFGAGIGILMLSSLGIMGLTDIPANPGDSGSPVFNDTGEAVGITSWGNSTTQVKGYVDVIENTVDWRYALGMMAAAILGGYFGAFTARRMDRNLVRWIVILIGFGLAAYYFYKQGSGGSLA